MLVASLCTHIILNARRYFHKCLNIQNPILYDSYHTSPLIQAALSVRALNRGTGLNLFKCASFPELTPLTFGCCFFFLNTCPEANSSKERRQIGRPPSSWQLNTVEVLDLFWGDWTSWALPWKTSGWRCWMGARVWKDGGRGGGGQEGGREGEVITSGD